MQFRREQESVSLHLLTAFFFFHSAVSGCIGAATREPESLGLRLLAGSVVDVCMYICHATATHVARLL